MGYGVPIEYQITCQRNAYYHRDDHKRYLIGAGKAAEPSGIVAELLKPFWEAAGAVPYNIKGIISESCILTECLYKGKEVALNIGNFRGLMLIEQGMRLVVCSGGTYQAESKVVEITEMQCCFMLGCVTTDVTCIVWELQVKQEALF